MGITRTVTTQVYCDVCGKRVIGWESEETGVSREWAKYHARCKGCTAGQKVICKECRIKQRIKKCSLQKKWGAASAMVEVDVDGNDLGPILPDAYRIKLKDVSQATLDSVEQQLLEIDGIDPDIRTPSEEATILSDLERAISTVGGVIVIILAVVSVVIIANTIKITIFSRRKEISIMRLVGATNTFIKMPFIIEGMLIGLISALIAFGGLWVAYNYATQFIMTNPSSWLEIAIGRLINFKDIAHYMLAGFAIGGCGLGIIGSNLFIRRHLKV